MRSAFAFLIRIYFVLAVLLLLNCAPPKLKPLSKIPECPSSIEGVFHHQPRWLGKVPMLLVEKEGFPEPIYGKIIEQNDAGIIFDQERFSRFSDPEPRLYKYNRFLIAAVDSNRQVIYGELPQKYAPTWAIEFHIRPLDKPLEKPHRFTVKPNEFFAYCLAPGDYKITAMLFEASNRDIDIGVEIPDLRFRVESGKANYIGDIFLDAPVSAETHSLQIPYKIGSRPGGAAIIGALGGAIGAAIYATALAAKGVIGVHTIHIENRSPYGFQGHREGVVNLITWSQNSP